MAKVASAETPAEVTLLKEEGSMMAYCGAVTTIPFFTGPHDDARISCLPTCVSDKNPAKYQPVSAGEHLRRKLGISNV